MKDRLVSLAAERFGRRPDGIVDLAADGSTRQYFRLVWENERTVIGALGPDHDENRAFLSFAKAFRGAGLPVPEIYAEDQAEGAWLLEDLGDTTLFRALSDARAEQGKGEGGEEKGETFPAEIVPLYRRVLEILPRFQVEGHRVVDYRLAYPRRAFDEQSIRWDLNYFKYHFLKLAHIPFNEQRLEDDFARLTAYLLEVPAESFLYRDFQSRNVMIRDGQPWFIDFQGGRQGAPHYDVASLLYDAKAALPPALRAELLEHYIESLGRLRPVDRDRFKEQFTGFVLVRLMQAMGAYGYRGFFERKRRFLESVPHAARNLEYLLGQSQSQSQSQSQRGQGQSPLQMLPELRQVFQQIVDRWAEPSRLPAHSPTRLLVLVRSFSYRDGYPADTEGHGGGFVFDCRSIPNPHHVEGLRELTGKDAPVADYIERQSATQEFWAGVTALVEPHVEKFLERGFESVSVAFGCTGGRHRSVYFAMKLTSYLKQRFPQAGVRIEHAKV